MPNVLRCRTLITCGGSALLHAPPWRLCCQNLLPPCTWHGPSPAQPPWHLARAGLSVQQMSPWHWLVKAGSSCWRWVESPAYLLQAAAS